MDPRNLESVTLAKALSVKNRLAGRLSQRVPISRPITASWPASGMSRRERP